MVNHSRAYQNVAAVSVGRHPILLPCATKAGKAGNSVKIKSPGFVLRKTWMQMLCVLG